MVRLFFIKSATICFFIAISYGIFIYGFVEKTDVDRFYPKISSPAVDAIILGSSRGFFGLNPDKVFANIFENRNVINFAFTMTTSPYGAIYLSAVKKKITQTVKDGIFVLEVSPLSLSVKDSTIKDPTQFREVPLMLNHLTTLNNHPNLEYILQTYEHSLYEILLQPFLKGKNNAPSVQLNGWMKAPPIKNKKALKKAIAKKEKQYIDVYSSYKVSDIRISEFKETIKFLNQYGKVFFVRLPLSPGLEKMEKEFWPDFDIFIRQISQEYSAPYLNFINDKGYATVDGNHLNFQAANKISITINQLIKTDLNVQ